jgi:hypothetical protein
VENRLLQKAMSWFGKPEIFNTDQGVQFTAAAFTKALSAQGIQISMDNIEVVISLSCSLVSCPLRRNNPATRLFPKLAHVPIEPDLMTQDTQTAEGCLRP